MFTATLIAEALRDGDIEAILSRLADAGCAPARAVWIDESRAADIPFSVDPERARTAIEGVVAGVDVIVQVTAEREKLVLVADMDSTMITVECIDELADYAGLKAEVAEVTERTMRGELDFEAALVARVALLKGLDVQAVEHCLHERVVLTPGARTLVSTMRARGASTVLVSGGFTHFAEPVAARIGFDRVIGNRLRVADGQLTGIVERPIVDAQSKFIALNEAIAARGIERSRSMAVGDGANDLAMIGAAGLGVAYHAKPLVAAAADARIVHSDMTALLYAQNIPRSEWVVD